MGGNALKNTQTIRLEKENYFLTQKEVLDKLKNLDRKLIPIQAYKNKKDFGDMDIIISKPKPDFEELKKYLEQNFSTKEIVKNSDVISFEYNLFQIDLIFIKEEDLEIAEFYFSYNDLNNIVGKIFHALGLKFGFNGLFYPLRTKHGNLLDEIFLTKNPKEIYEFIGYHFENYLNGFNELEDIFSFIISSKFFTPKKYLKEDEEKSLIDRQRAQKRKTYIGFLDWLERYLKENPNKSFFELNEDKSFYVEMIANSFPEAKLKEKIQAFEVQQKKLEEVNKKFNGQIVMKNIPNLTGKYLGDFIIKFKNHITEKYRNNFEESIFLLSEEEIVNNIIEFYSIINIST